MATRPEKSASTELSLANLVGEKPKRSTPLKDAQPTCGRFGLSVTDQPPWPTPHSSHYTLPRARTAKKPTDSSGVLAIAAEAKALAERKASLTATVGYMGTTPSGNGQVTLAAGSQPVAGRNDLLGPRLAAGAE